MNHQFDVIGKEVSIKKIVSKIYTIKCISVKYILMFFSLNWIYKIFSTFIGSASHRKFTSMGIRKPLSQRCGFPGPLVPSLWPSPIHLSSYLPVSPLVRWKDWFHLVLLSFLLAFLPCHFLQARFITGVTGIPAQALTSSALRNFDVKTSFACWVFILIHLKFCIIYNERLTYPVFRSVW